MTLPCTPTVRIRLGTGVTFGNAFVLGDTLNGVLGTNTLASNAIQTIDVTDTVQQISIRHGRDRMFEEYLPSEAVIQFQDFTGDWNPANTSSPYYPEVKPMRQVQVVTNYQSTEYFLYSGFIWSWDYEWADPSVDYAIVTIRAVDAFRLLALANITSVTGAANKDLPGERIDLILDEIDWPASIRAIDTGDTELEGDPGDERSTLEAIQTIENSDLGAFFIDHTGKPTYYDRNTLSTKAAGTAYQFDDTGTNIQYQAIDISYDETELANSVTLTRLSGQPQTASDSASIDEYFLRSYSRSGLMMETNTLALQRANQILNYRKQVRVRVDSLTLDISSDSNRVEPALSLEIGDPIIVTKQMAGGTSITLRLTIQGHSHDITPDRWITTFSTAYPLSTAFILGSTEFGILGTSTL
jgi:hypothetical protein